MQQHFNPHLPYGRWRNMDTLSRLKQKFQSTPSLRKVTRVVRVTFFPDIISIHTFLTEGDRKIKGIKRRVRISIHTFLTEGDLGGRRHHPINGDFNPHLPYGRWHQKAEEFRKYIIISIHTFLTEGDEHPIMEDRALNQFQSTPSLRKVT